MKMKFIVWILAPVFWATPHLWAQGPLTPPGTPAATMKTLMQLAPRTPISSAPYTITEAGSYYLTTNLLSTGHGILVQADHVSIDLMGFTVSGDGDNGDYGLYLDGDADRPVRDVTVCNGTFEHFFYGARIEHARQNRLERLQIVRCASSGLIFVGVGGSLCSGNRVMACTIIDNNGYGIYLSGNGGHVDGNIIEDCVIIDNANNGIQLYGNLGSCSGNRIQGCSLRANGNYGISLMTTSNTVIKTCSVCDQASTGIRIENSSGNNAVQNCLIAKNDGYGIYCVGGGGNRIDQNFISANGGSSDYGIYTATSQKNLITRNICIGQTNNFSISANDTYGPIVTDTGTLATSGAAAHPWANFSR